MISSTRLAIREAARRDTLRIFPREGRFGSFFAVTDEFGTLEVHDTFEEAQASVQYNLEAC